MPLLAQCENCGASVKVKEMNEGRKFYEILYDCPICNKEICEHIEKGRW